MYSVQFLALVAESMGISGIVLTEATSLLSALGSTVIEVDFLSTLLQLQSIRLVMTRKFDIVFIKVIFTLFNNY
jgi:hypothetical protein